MGGGGGGRGFGGMLPQGKFEFLSYIRYKVVSQTILDHAFADFDTQIRRHFL